jgi:serine-type D-Ala-D-Ala carboxypeptidase/endopeptidase (penicillin-binding protein 4)
MTRILTLFSFVILLAPQASPAENILAKLDSVVADTMLDNARIGIEIYDITSDSAIYNVDSDKLLMPASNLKLFTTAAALELLGPKFRFETKFWKVGDIGRDSVLYGSLVIAGGGDPLISGRFRNHMTEIFDLWADSLISRGIKEINGMILVDSSFFAPPELGPGWSWDDLSYWYACPVTALAFNDNCIDLKFLPGKKVGEQAEIIFEPKTDFIQIEKNTTLTGPSGSDFSIDYYRAPDSKKVSFFGNISIDDTIGRRDFLSVNKPDLYCATILGNILISRGIKVFSDYVNYYRIPPIIFSPKIPLFTWDSDSLPVIINVINKNSQNLFAEMTLKTLGAKLGREGSFKGGCAVTDSFFRTIGITSKDLAMYDGSGLSYTNQVKPDAIIKLLKYMHKSKNYEVFYNSLGNPALDRSVRNRLKDIPGRENVRAKGGYIMNVSTLSGYLTGPKNGHLYAFSIMVNNYTCTEDDVVSWQDKLLTLLLKEF